MAALLGRHLDLQRLDPTPISDIGKEVIKCGYVLAAYAVMVVQMRGRGGGKELIAYFRDALGKLRISFGESEMRWYLSEEYIIVGEMIGKESGGRKGS